MQLSGLTAMHNSSDNINADVEIVNGTRGFCEEYHVEVNKEELFEDDHYLSMTSSMSTIDSDKITNLLTEASSNWTFDLYYYVGSLNPEYGGEEILCNANYLVNVK